MSLILASTASATDFTQLSSASLLTTRFCPIISTLTLFIGSREVDAVHPLQQLLNPGPDFTPFVLKLSAVDLVLLELCGHLAQLLFRFRQPTRQTFVFLSQLFGSVEKRLDSFI
jgi:hypothetical protein